MLLEVLMQYSCIISRKLPPIERRFRDIQIVITTNFVVVSSIGIKRVDCIFGPHRQKANNDKTDKQQTMKQ